MSFGELHVPSAVFNDFGTVLVGMHVPCVCELVVSVRVTTRKPSVFFLVVHVLARGKCMW